MIELELDPRLEFSFLSVSPRRGASAAPHVMLRQIDPGELPDDKGFAQDVELLSRLLDILGGWGGGHQCLELTLAVIPPATKHRDGKNAARHSQTFASEVPGAGL